MFQVKSKKFLAELRRRKARTPTNIGARITTSPGNAWWYYHEFGTATQREEDPSIERYRIDPVNAEALAWPDPANPGERIVRSFVYHPGVPPRAMVRKVLGLIRRIVAQDVASSLLQSNFQWAVVKTNLLASGMRKALQKIVESIDRELPGTREDGKLAGQRASEVFERDAQIVEVS